MKKRLGFVSNSSSSSFLVIDGKPGNHLDLKFNGRELIVPQSFPGYECEFCRGHNDYDDFGSRLCFAAMLAHSVEEFQRTNGTKLEEHQVNEEFWKKYDFKDFTGLVAMLREVLMEKFKCRSVCFALVPFYYDEEGDVMQFWYNSRKVKLPGTRGYDATKDGVECHIDHGSNWFEMPENLLIFKSKKALADFLFGKRSYVAERSDEDDFEAPNLHDDMWATMDFSKEEKRDDEE